MWCWVLVIDVLKKICEVVSVLFFVKFFESCVKFVRYIDDVVDDVVVELIF